MSKLKTPKAPGLKVKLPTYPVEKLEGSQIKNFQQVLIDGTPYAQFMVDGVWYRNPIDDNLFIDDGT